MNKKESKVFIAVIWVALLFCFLLLLPVGSYASNLSDAESNLAMCLLNNQDLAEQNEYIKESVAPMAADYLQNIKDYNDLLQAIQQHFREVHPDD